MRDCLPIVELDDTLGLTDTGGDTLADVRTGKNGRHRLVGLLRQSLFGQLTGYEDVNDAERLCRDPAMRWVVGDQAITGSAASASQMGRFETRWLSRPENLRPCRSSRPVDRERSPVAASTDYRARHGFEREPDLRRAGGRRYNGHFGCTCYHPLFVFNQFGDVERCALRPGNVDSAAGWRAVLEPVIPLPGECEAPLLPRRCRLRQSRDVRGSRS